MEGSMSPFRRGKLIHRSFSGNDTIMKRDSSSNKGGRRMNLTQHLAEEVIRRLEKNIPFAMNMMDKRGMMIASTNPNRVGDIHSGAQEVIQRLETVIIDENNQHQFPNTKKGVNVPLYFDDKIIGVFGITGEPEEVLPIAKVLKVTVEIMIEQIFQEREQFHSEQMLQHWLQKLFHPLLVNEEEVVEDGKWLIPEEEAARYQIVLIQGEGASFHLRDIERQIARACPDILFITAFQKDEVVLCLKQEEPSMNQVRKLSIADFSVAVGTKELGILGMRKSYMYAKQLLTDVKEKGNPALVEDYKLEIVTAHIPREEMTHVFADEIKALNQLQEEYRHTLKMYIRQHFQLSSTAKALHIHRNTLNYRLEMIEKKVGLSPKNARDIFSLWLLLQHGT